MTYSKEQQVASLFNRRTDGGYSVHDNRYIINKREEGQKRFFKCCCCGDEIDLKDSIDYVGAVEQWEQLGGKCYACGNGFCHCKETGKKWG